MITLHDSNVASLNNNGYGSLIDAISCKVSEEINGAYELLLEYPTSGKHYSDIKMRKIIYAKPNPHSAPQPFRIYSMSKPINRIVTINACHKSYDLSDYPVSEFKATSPSDTMNKLKEYSVVACPFTLNSTVTATGEVSVDSPKSIRSILGNNVLRAYGGEYEFDESTVYHLSKRGTNRGFSIRYGKNLLDLRQEENMSNVYTGVYPFWIGTDADGNSVSARLPDKIIKVEGTFDFTRVYPLDLSDIYTNIPSEAQIREQTAKFITNNKIGIPEVSIDVSFIQLSKSSEYSKFSMLEDVRLGDELSVEFMEMGISATARCVKTIYDVIKDAYDNLELGDAKSTLATTIAGGFSSVDNKISEQKRKFDADIGSIRIGLAQVDILIAEKADITSLEATNIVVTNLVARTADIETAIIDVALIQQLVAENVKINNALILKADIDDLNVLDGEFVKLSANIAEIDTLLSGNLTSDNIHSLILSSDKVTVENAFIKDAMIDTMSVSKIKAGDISTNKFRIVSDSGNMLITDNTIQISDATRVRVQIGKDATNDYNMYVWDAAGKLMFDATGLKADGIKNKIIRDDMISDTANISGGKLDISSVVTSINDGSTTIKGSKVKLDGTSQTLDIAFTTLTTTVTEEIEKNLAYRIDIVSSNGNIFKNGNISTILEAKIYKANADVTATIPDSCITWKRKSISPESDTYWDSQHIGFGSIININQADVDEHATFTCELDM